jgi:hypothetical protein
MSLLPPTPRDFDIHRQSLVMHMSTWQIAEKHGISQTRVRQIVQRVSHWLAATVPVKTELEQQQEVRLAQHLAADQMRQQIQTLQNYWEGSGDPKYLRHQTRVIAALARLGIVPGTIEAIAADATVGPYDPTEPQPPWSEDDPWRNTVQNPKSEAHSQQPQDQHSTLDLGPGTLDCGPPPGDFSASSHSAAAVATPIPSPNTATALPPATSEPVDRFTRDTIEGLNYMETRLLTRIDNTPPADDEQLDRLRESLAEVRACKAKYEIRVSPHIPGAEIRLNPTPPTQRNEQQQTELTEASRS